MSIRILNLSDNRTLKLALEENESVVEIGWSVMLNKKSIISLWKNERIVKVGVGQVSALGFRELNLMMKRNRELWMHKIERGCVLNVLCRVMVLGGECEGLPLEIVYYILRFVAGTVLMKEGEIKRAMAFSTDILSLGRSREEYLKDVFGVAINFVLPKIKMRGYWDDQRN